MMKLTYAIALGAALMAAPYAVALAQPAGPVVTACKEDIAKLCANLPRNGSVRACLTKHESEVSAPCKQALDTTGGGRLPKQ
jgi:predicted ABC-type transport system involved in lysophospholipase L1 biosynthesis ATPase subunit